MLRKTSHDILPTLMFIGFGFIVVAGIAVEVLEGVAEQKCIRSGYMSATSHGFSTWCSKVVNGSTVTVKVR